MLTRLLPYLLVCSVWLPWAAPVARACPGCKEALIEPAETANRQAAARAFNLSIGMLLLVPAGLVGGVTMLVVRAQRQVRGTRSP